MYLPHFLLLKCFKWLTVFLMHNILWIFPLVQHLPSPDSHSNDMCYFNHDTHHKMNESPVALAGVPVYAKVLHVWCGHRHSGTMGRDETDWPPVSDGGWPIGTSGDQRRWRRPRIFLHDVVLHTNDQRFSRKWPRAKRYHPSVICNVKFPYRHVNLTINKRNGDKKTCPPMDTCTIYYMVW